MLTLAEDMEKLADGIILQLQADPELPWSESFRTVVELTALALRRIERIVAMQKDIDSAPRSEWPAFEAVRAGLDKDLQAWLRIAAASLRDLGFTRPSREKIAEAMREAGERDGIYRECVELVAANLIR